MVGLAHLSDTQLLMGLTIQVLLSIVMFYIACLTFSNNTFI